MKDPEKFLKEQNIRLACPVNGGRPGLTDPQHRAWVNHELFYFSDAAAKQKFLRQPLRYCGQITDPVTRHRFQPTARSPRYDYQGRLYLFENRLSLRTFVALPDSFAHRKGA